MRLRVRGQASAAVRGLRSLPQLEAQLGGRGERGQVEVDVDERAGLVAVQGDLGPELPVAQPRLVELVRVRVRVRVRFRVRVRVMVMVRVRVSVTCT